LAAHPRLPLLLGLPGGTLSGYCTTSPPTMRPRRAMSPPASSRFRVPRPRPTPKASSPTTSVRRGRRPRVERGHHRVRDSPVRLQRFRTAATPTATAPSAHAVVLPGARNGAGCAAHLGVDGAQHRGSLRRNLQHEVDVTGVVAKPEFSAATMADGYARSTSGFGVVAATSGSGVMNLVAGLARGCRWTWSVSHRRRWRATGHPGFQRPGGFDRCGAVVHRDLPLLRARVERPEDIASTCSGRCSRRFAVDRGVVAAQGCSAGYRDGSQFHPAVRGGSRSRRVGPVATWSPWPGTGKVVLVVSDQVARNDSAQPRGAAGPGRTRARHHRLARDHPGREPG